MELFRRRPMALICFISALIMILALNLNRFFRGMLFLIFAICGFACIILLIRCFKKNIVWAKKLIALILFTIITLALLISVNSFAIKNDYVNDHIQDMVDVAGTITDVRFKSTSESSFEVNISSVNGESANLGIIMNVSAHSSLKADDSFTARGNLYTLSTKDESYIIADGFNGKLVCENGDDVKIKGVQTDYYVSVFKKANSYFQNILYENTDKETGTLVGALLLGNRDAVGDKTVRDFARCGISHMLALSGLHMAIIIGFFDIIMRNLLIDKRYRCVILIFLALAYLAMTGFSPSASRSVIMLCIVYISYIINNDTDSITSLFIALVLILFFAPYSVYDIGLWMSFFATLGILIVSDMVSVLKYHIKKKPIYIQILIKITVSVAITLAAVFFTCMFTWLYSGEISLASPLTNLIFSPLMTIILVLGILLVLLSPIGFLAGVLGQALVLVSDVFVTLASVIARWRGITVSLKYDFVPFIIVPLTATLLVFLVIKLKHKWIISVPPMLAVIAFSIALGVYNSSNADVFDVIYFKNKRNEMLIVTTLNETSICDISSGGYNNLYSACYESSQLEYLTEIENIILTHYHSYHSGALLKICNKYFVRNVYLPLPEEDYEWEIQSEIFDSLADSGTNVYLYRRGYEIKDSNENTISVSPCEYVDRSTHPIFSVSVSSDTKTFTYATSAFLEADAESTIESTDIMVFGNHGATVRSFAETEFMESKFEKLPQVIVFASPHEMLESDKLISYVHSLYQKGHTVFIDGKDYYKFDMN